LLTLENDPRFVQAAAPADPVVVAYFTLVIGETSSDVALCLPYPMLEPVFDEHSRSTDQVERDLNRATAAAITQRRLTDVEVDVAVRFDPVAMRSADIGQWQVGDVVTLGHRTTAPLSVTSATTVFAKAVPGSSGRSMAVLVVPAR
jgi:flagellar motor switch protein FliM